MKKLKKYYKKYNLLSTGTLGNYLHVGLCLQCFQKVIDEKILFYVTLTLTKLHFRSEGKATKKALSSSEENSQNTAEEKAFRCDECNRSFKHRFSLAGHMAAHSRNKLDKKDVVDTPSSKKKTSPGNQPRKTFISIEGMTYSCSRCNLDFVVANEFKRHMTGHNVFSPFTCSFCNRPFSQSGHLKAHMLTHTGEKPFSCDQCSKSFSRNSDLQIHYRVHTGEKPFKCPICEKPFSFSSSLRNHMRLHAGEKPFRCKFCERTFAQKIQCQKHIRVHHDLGQIFLKTEVKVEDDKNQEESQEGVATKGKSENHLAEVKEEVDKDFVEKVKEVKGIGNEGTQNEFMRVKEEFVQVKEEIDPVKEEVEQEPSVGVEDPLAR